MRSRVLTPQLLRDERGTASSSVTTVPNAPRVRLPRREAARATSPRHLFEAAAVGPPTTRTTRTRSWTAALCEQYLDLRDQGPAAGPSHGTAGPIELEECHGLARHGEPERSHPWTRRGTSAYGWAPLLGVVWTASDARIPSHSARGRYSAFRPSGGRNTASMTLTSGISSSRRTRQAHGRRSRRGSTSCGSWVSGRRGLIAGRAGVALASEVREEEAARAGCARRRAGSRRRAPVASGLVRAPPGDGRRGVRRDRCRCAGRVGRRGNAVCERRGNLRDGDDGIVPGPPRPKTGSPGLSDERRSFGRRWSSSGANSGTPRKALGPAISSTRGGGGIAPSRGRDPRSGQSSLRADGTSAGRRSGIASLARSDR